MFVKLIRKIKVYAPENIGEMDILIAGDKIADVYRDLSPWKAVEGVEVIDGRGFIALPGFIDGHVHVLGGGGEGGFSTRTRELEAWDIVSSGVTTLVGCLGTDSAGRSMENLIAKVKELKEFGLNAYAYSGSYHVPVKTLTGSIERDIVFIEEVIGAGEIAIADHRSSQPTMQELARIAAEAHVAGMLSGKAGIVNFHVGDGKRGLGLLREMLDSTDLPKCQLYPTHTNRNEKVFMEAIEYALRGGIVDMTTSTNEHFIKKGEVPCAKGLSRMLDAGVPIENITFTSDGGGSLPAFDENGDYEGMSPAKVSSLLEAVAKSVREENVPLDQAIRVATTNPARILKLLGKGQIKKGFDADILILDQKDFLVEMAISNGMILFKK